MDAKISEINKQFDALTNEMDTIYTKQSNLTKTKDTITSLLQQNRKLLNELNETWRTGRMHAHIQDVEMKFKHDQQTIFHEFEKETYLIKKEKNQLEEKESILFSKRRKLMK